LFIIHHAQAETKHLAGPSFIKPGEIPPKSFSGLMSREEARTR